MASGPRAAAAAAPLQRRLTSARGGATGGDASALGCVAPRAARERKGRPGQDARNPRRACVCLRVSVSPSGSLSPPLVVGRQDLTLLPSPGRGGAEAARGGRAGGEGRLRGATCERLGCAAAAVFLVLKTLYTHWERHLSEVMVCLYRRAEPSRPHNRRRPPAPPPASLSGRGLPQNSMISLFEHCFLCKYVLYLFRIQL